MVIAWASIWGLGMGRRHGARPGATRRAAIGERNVGGPQQHPKLRAGPGPAVFHPLRVTTGVGVELSVWRPLDRVHPAKYSKSGRAGSSRLPLAFLFA